MKRKVSQVVCTIAVAAAMITAFPVASAQAAERFVTIGTAGVTGVYYPAGGAICRLVNRGRKDHGIRCSVESTGGSIYNLNAVKNGELDFGIAQSDWIYHAVNGMGQFQDQGKNTKLRTVFSLHSEPFTVVARNGSGIEHLDGLKGKRVNIGNAGSGARATMEKVMQKKGWGADVFKVASELKGTEQGNALCDKKVDAVIFTVGHPNGLVNTVTEACKALIVPLEGSEVDDLVKETPYYSKATIPGGMYPNNPKDIPTFGVKAVLVASENVDAEVVYQFVKAVFDNLDNFKTLHPVFSGLEPSRMITEGAVAPLHEGAVRYYKERGWM